MSIIWTVFDFTACFGMAIEISTRAEKKTHTPLGPSWIVIFSQFYQWHSFGPVPIIWPQFANLPSGLHVTFRFVCLLLAVLIQSTLFHCLIPLTGPHWWLDITELGNHLEFRLDYGSGMGQMIAWLCVCLDCVWWRNGKCKWRQVPGISGKEMLFTQCIPNDSSIMKASLVILIFLFRLEREVNDRSACGDHDRMPVERKWWISVWAQKLDEQKKNNINKNIPPYIFTIRFTVCGIIVLHNRRWNDKLCTNNWCI